MGPGGAGRRRDADPDPDPLRCPRSCPADAGGGGGRVLTLFQRSPCEATASRRGLLLGNDRPPPARGGRRISARPPAERGGEASPSLAEPKRSVSRRWQAEAGTPAAGGRAAGPAPAPSPPAPPPGAGRAAGRGRPADRLGGMPPVRDRGRHGQTETETTPGRGGAARRPLPARDGALRRAPGAPGGSAALRGAGRAPPAATRSRGSVSPSRGAGGSGGHSAAPSPYRQALRRGERAGSWRG